MTLKPSKLAVHRYLTGILGEHDEFTGHKLVFSDESTEDSLKFEIQAPNYLSQDVLNTIRQKIGHCCTFSRDSSYGYMIFVFRTPSSFTQECLIGQKEEYVRILTAGGPTMRTNACIFTFSAAVCVTCAILLNDHWREFANPYEMLPFWSAVFS